MSNIATDLKKTTTDAETVALSFAQRNWPAFVLVAFGLGALVEFVISRIV